MLQVKIYTSKGEVSTLNASSVVLPGVSGELQILPGHAQLYSLLGSGNVTVRTNEGDESFELTNGEVHVVDDVVTLILVVD